MSGTETESTFSTKTASEGDIRAVMTSLSIISEADLIVAGYSVEDATEQMIAWSTEGEAVTILNDETPIAILIFLNVDQNVLGTSFMTTAGFFEADVSPNDFVRKYIDVKMKALPGVALVLTTYSQHPSLATWYRLMGFRAPATDGISYTFVRDPR